MSQLKMKPEHRQQLRDALTVLYPSIKQAALNYQANGLSRKRFRWDTLHASKLRAGDSVGMRTGWPVYDYLNDEHIDSALRDVMREFGIDWAAQP